MDGDDNFARAGTSGVPCALPEDKLKELERESITRAREERLKSILSPVEGLVMNFQSLLVWENTQPSAVLFVCVNIVFWLAVTTNQRVVFISAMICFIVMCIESFRFRVWPDMQVNPKDPNEEDWTPLHVRLLSVPELCDHVAHAWQVADEWYNAYWELRRHEPAKFCTFTCLVCLTMATIGYYIPGVLISYIILICLLLWPAYLYHDVSGKLYTKLQPFLNQFEQSMESLERKEKRQRRLKRTTRNADGGEETSSDSELNEFCPTPGPAVDAALSHAARVFGSTPSSSRLGTPTYGLIGDLIPRGASIEFTDDELNTDNESRNILHGLTEMPSYQDRALDPSGDELDSRSTGNLLDGKTDDPTRLRPPSDLFGMSTDDDFGDHELDTPESPLDDLLQPRLHERKSRSSDLAAESSTQSLPPAAAQLLSQTVAAVMSEAITSFAGLGNPTAATVEKQSVKHPTLPVKSVQLSGPTDSDAIPSGLTPSPQSDEELAEFEMLDSSELDEERSPSTENSPGAINAGITYLSSLFSRRK
nr:reticulophagy regulator 3-like [Lytechinus pictus]